MTLETFLFVLLAAFATYRISRMVAVEEGPFELFLTARGFIYDRFPRPWVASGITCPLCISWWISLPVAIIFVLQFHLEWYNIFWLWFALSGIASFLYKVEQ